MLSGDELYRYYRCAHHNAAVFLPTPALPSSGDTGETLAPPAAGPLLSPSCRRPLPWWRSSSPKGAGNLRLQYAAELGRRAGPGQVEVAPGVRPCGRRTRGACGGGGDVREDLSRWWWRLGLAGPDLGLLGHDCMSAPRRLWWRAAGRPGRPTFRSRWWGRIDLRPAWLPYAGAAAPVQGVVAGFFGCMGSDEDGGGCFCSGEVGSQVSGSIAWQRRWCVCG
jgi:hypothetical protein